MSFEKINRIKTVLKGVLEKDARHFMACCPLHDDKTPSMYVNLYDDGGYSFKCLAGCDPKAIREYVNYTLLGETRESRLAEARERRNQLKPGDGGRTRKSSKKSADGRNTPTSSDVESAMPTSSNADTPPQTAAAPDGEIPATPSASQAAAEKKESFADMLKRVRKIYDYRDKDGVLICQTLRFEPKDFRQRRPDPAKKDGWRYTLDGMIPPLYRLPQLLSAIAKDPAETVWMVEGEKDADTLADIGLVATTSPMGAGKFKRHHAESLRGAECVCIVPDNDEPGRKHAEKVAEELFDVGVKSKIVTLPAEIYGEKTKDVTDFFLAVKEVGETVSRFRKLAEAATLWTPPAVRRELLIPGPGRGNLPFVEDVARTVAPFNELFNRAGKVVRVETLGNSIEFSDLLSIQGVTIFEKYCLFIKLKNEGKMQTQMTDKLSAITISAPAFIEKLPRIMRISDCEIPVRCKDGSVKFCRRGYDLETLTYCREDAPDVTDISTVAEAIEIIEDLLRDFPFDTAKGSDRAEVFKNTAVAYLLSGYCANLYPGERAPIFLAEANREGVGKDYLLALGPIVINGQMPAFLPPTINPEESKKRLFACAKAGHLWMIISNVRHFLNDPPLEAASTSPYIMDRPMSTSVIESHPNIAVYALSANNLTYTSDLARRLMRIRMAFYGANLDDRIYKHPDLYAYAFAQRPKILGALKRLVSNWIEKGCPNGTKDKASFGGWARAVGGVLEAAGLKNPIGADDITQTPTEEVEHMEILLRQLYDKPTSIYTDYIYKMDDLLEVIKTYELFYWIKGLLDAERGGRIAFAKLLKNHFGRDHGGLSIDLAPDTAQTRYKHYRISPIRAMTAQK